MWCDVLLSLTQGSSKINTASRLNFCHILNTIIVAITGDFLHFLIVSGLKAGDVLGAAGGNQESADLQR